MTRLRGGIHKIVSNGSCTTHCIVLVFDEPSRQFGAEHGTLTTFYSAMHDQQVIDAYTDNLRLTCAASQSLIPVDTRLAKGSSRILPHFQGKIEAIALRVTTINVTAVDLNVTETKNVSVSDINQAFSAQLVDNWRALWTMWMRPWRKLVSTMIPSVVILTAARPGPAMPAW